MRGCKGLFLFFTIWFGVGYAQKSIPKELQFAFDYLDQHWHTKEITVFKKQSEQEGTVLGEYHFGIGMHLRSLLQHHKKASSIIYFFDAQGIHHFDDMSAIIVTSYHRYLNQKDIALQTQVNKCLAYWQPILECEKKREIEAVAIYTRFKVGDTLHIKMPVDTRNNAVDFVCDTENVVWNFDGAKDLLLTVLLIEKYHINSKSNVFFKVKIITKNHSDTQVLMKPLGIGDTFDFKLATAWKID